MFKEAPMKKISPRSLCRISLIAAIYFCLSVFFAPISFGSAQMRVAEALTILPAMSPLGILGVTLGCLISNLYGAFTGANILGILDVFFGTFATFSASILTYLLRGFKLFGVPIASTIPPILVNAFIIGAELSYVTTGSIFSPVFLIYALQIGLGQFLSCTVLGFFLYKALKRGNIKI